jgi:hypothetical protein
VQLTDIYNSKQRIGFLKKDTVIIDTKSNQNFRVPKDIYVKFFTLQGKDGFYYLKSKNNIFKIHPKEISHIQNIMKMHEDPQTYTDWTDRRKALQKKEMIYDYTWNAGLAFNYSNSGFFKSLVDDQSSDFVKFKSININLLKTIDDIGVIGGGFIFENATQNAVSDDRSISANSLLISLSYQPAIFENYITDISISSSIYSKYEEKSVNTTNTFNLNQNFIQFKFEKPISYDWGNILIGLNYQRKWIKINSSNNDADLSPAEDTENTFGFSLNIQRGFRW